MADGSIIMPGDRDIMFFVSFIDHESEMANVSIFDDDEDVHYPSVNVGMGKLGRLKVKVSKNASTTVRVPAEFNVDEWLEE